MSLVEARYNETDGVGEMNSADQAIFSLHKYFFWCDRMRVHYIEALLRFKTKDDEPENNFAEIKNEIGTMEILWSTDIALYLSYWYSGLYVVIEGWRELGICDPVIDDLLQSPYVTNLKRYRHGTFHFQKDDYDIRFQELFDGGVASALWINQLSIEFNRYFKNWYRTKLNLEFPVLADKQSMNETDIITQAGQIYKTILKSKE
ncbi:MAG: hypothetical protein P4N41_10750 [Negativicutes bacterium]|nr:hypothetical protein [Negativicutes bacterium]